MKPALSFFTIGIQNSFCSSSTRSLPQKQASAEPSGCLKVQKIAQTVTTKAKHWNARELGAIIIPWCVGVLSQVCDFDVAYCVSHFWSILWSTPSGAQAFVGRSERSERSEGATASQEGFVSETPKSFSEFGRRIGLSRYGGANLVFYGGRWIGHRLLQEFVQLVVAV